MGGWEVYVPDTSNSSYGTATNEVRHYRHCSSKAFYVDLYIWRISQDLHTRTSCEHPRRNFIQAPMQKIFKIFMQGPLEEDFNRISARSFQKVPDHVRTPRGFHQDLFKSVSKWRGQDHVKASVGIVQVLEQKLHARTLKRISQGRHKRTCCSCSGSYKILIQEPPKSLPQELSYKHHASASSSCKDLLERISPGSPQDLLC